MSKSILIVEDEPIIADDIAATLEELNYQVSSIVDNADDALNVLNQKKTDLILMDISIEGEMDGIQLAQRINKTYNIAIVYLTSFYDKNTLDRAKSTHPAGYIVKPFDETDLKVNIEIALVKNQTPVLKQQVNLNIDKFFIRENNELLSIELSEVNWIEAYDNYSYIFTKKGKHLISHTLKSIEEKLFDKGFVRIHRSYLVNFNKITSVSEGYIYIEDKNLPLGKSYKQSFYDQLLML